MPAAPDMACYVSNFKQMLDLMLPPRPRVDDIRDIKIIDKILSSRAEGTREVAVSRSASNPDEPARVIKLLHTSRSDGTQDPDKEYLFLRELKTHIYFSRHQHPNISQCYEISYILPRHSVMELEYFPLGDFKDCLEKEKLNDLQRLGLIAGAASALSFLHSRGFTHCDVKNSNFCVAKAANGSYLAKLIDFGACKPSGDFYTQGGKIGDTRAYRCPELWPTKGQRPLKVSVGPQCDAWSLGLVILLMMSGCRETPWDCASPHRDTRFNVFYQQMVNHSPGTTTKIIFREKKYNKLNDFTHFLISNCMDLRPQMRFTMARVCKEIETVDLATLS